MSSSFYEQIQTKFLRFSSFENVIEELYLTSLVDSYQRILTSKILSSTENKIRDEFMYDLEFNNPVIKEFLQNKTVKLANENRIIQEDKNVFRTDIEFFVSGLGTFVVECKKLSSAEQRYIDEGVARFTSEFYSRNEDECGMVSFITGGNVSSIISGLKTRVASHTPGTNMSKFIKKLCIGQTNSFHSEHIRKSKQIIVIHHIFFDLTRAA